MSKPEVISDYVIHSAASVFPLMEGDTFQSLVDSIAVHGVQNPIVSYKGEVLDGRNRLRAVMKLRDEGHKVDLPCVEWDSKCGLSAIEWITAQNLDRRHLRDEARAMIGARLARMLKAEAKKVKQASQFNSETGKAAAAKKATPAATADSPSPQKRDRRKSEERTTAAQAAKRMKVSTHKMKQAMAVDKAVEAGEVAPEVVKEIVAGKKKLKDVVPTRSKGKSGESRRKNGQLAHKIAGELMRLRRHVETLAQTDSAYRQEALRELKACMTHLSTTASATTAEPTPRRPDDELRAAVTKRWESMRLWETHWALADMEAVRKLFVEIIRDEQKNAGK
jgi:ParB-like chromosome segregation protein Spo0J